MAENSDDRHDSVGLTTKWFGLNLSGKDALGIFLFITLLAMMGLDAWENVQRSNEHDGIVCMIKLNLYMQQLPTGAPMDWRRMPVDLYSCIPPFLYKQESPR